MANTANQKMKDQVRERAFYICEYCFSQESYSPDTFSIEHIIPTSKNGQTILTNLALACQGCNNRKYTHIQAIDSLTGELANLYHPRKNNWQNHFRWSDDFLEIIGITATGRATVNCLDLNRAGVVNLRKVLRDIDKHPPTLLNLENK